MFVCAVAHKRDPNDPYDHQRLRKVAFDDSVFQEMLIFRALSVQVIFHVFFTVVIVQWIWIRIDREEATAARVKSEVLCVFSVQS